jgi:hypothetical protein
LRTGSLALDGVDLQDIGAHQQTFEKVVTKLRTAAMPPAGRPRPDAATYDRVASWLETELDRVAAARPNPGVRPPLHRLNHAEYKNAARDLLALDDLPREMEIDVLLPADDASYGFDNIADGWHLADADRALPVGRAEDQPAGHRRCVDADDCRHL